MQRPATRPSGLLRRSPCVAAAAAALVCIAACKSATPKSFLHAEWSTFQAVNPTEIAIVRVDPAKLPSELRPEVLRDAIREQVLAHRYSPISFDYIDRGNPLPASASKSDAPAPPPVVKLELFITSFDASRYDTSNAILITGDFLFTDTSNQTLLASVKSEQRIDLSAEARRNVSKSEAVRTAARRFVDSALAPMPVRRVEAGKTARS